jgi:hypothetical protein
MRTTFLPCYIQTDESMFSLTRYNLRNSENTLFVRKPSMVNEVLVTKCCGMSYLKMYKQYPLLVNSKEKLTTYSTLHMKRTPARESCKSVARCSILIFVKV